MRRAAAILALLALGGCVATPKSACPAGQSRVATAQLFLAGPAPKDPAALSRFVAAEVTPRFPDGVTVVEGGGRWTGAENRMIRDASKVLLIVMPAKGAHHRIEAVREAYRRDFGQDSTVLLPPPSCVAL